SIDDITVDEGFGGEDNDNEWFPLDTITVDVDIDNNGPKDIDNVALGWGLYDKTSQKWVIDDEESDFDLNDDDTESKSLTFKLDEDVDEFDSSHEYVFYAWANGEDNEAVDPALDATCDYASQDVEMQIEEFVILDNVQYPDAAQCTEEVTITGDVWNLDDNDQDDVYVLVTNVALGLKEQRMEVGDIDSLENTPFEFMFKVPEGLDEKTYPIMFDVYDDHDDVYENSFNEESSFMVPLTVKGSCGASAGSATVSATLESGGKAGEAMVVKTTVTNKGTKTATFTVNAAGYSAWASGASVSEDSFTLEAGKSKDVSITLQTKDDAKGEQTLNVEVLSGSELVMTQPVSVMVQGSSAGFLSAITGNAVGDGKSLWIIGALNVLLVFAIIVIAIRFFLRR
ncbi:MAG: putative S-layer protein, partial [Nanoarchaeota archaeon]